MKYLLISIFILANLMLGCKSKPKFIDPAYPQPTLSKEEYKKLLTKFTQHDEQYAGFSNLFHVDATIISSQVKMAQLDRIRYHQQLNKNDALKAREKAIQEMSSQSQVFISFFSPEKSLKDLHRPKSLWKAYIEYNGVRYPGKFRKAKLQPLVIRELYPKTTNWSKGYVITFPVPMRSVEKSDVKFIMTSSAGHVHFNYSASE